MFIIFASVLFLVDILFADFQFVYDPDPNVRETSFFVCVWASWWYVGVGVGVGVGGTRVSRPSVSQGEGTCLPGVCLVAVFDIETSIPRQAGNENRAVVVFGLFVSDLRSL